MLAVTLALTLAVLTGADPTTPRSVTVDGRTVPVRVLAPNKREPAAPKTDPRAEVLAALPLDGATPFVHALRDETLVRTFANGAKKSADSALFRVAKDGTVRRFTLPVNDREWRPVVCGKRYLVMALESAGTLIWDLEENAVVQHRPQFGGFGNAISSGPACSPDGRYAVVPTPYGGRVTIVRLADGVLATNIPVEAPGRVTWTAAGIAIRTQRLPYE